MSRRTGTAYKAKSPGKLAQHNKAQVSGDMVNAAVVWRKFTSLSGEICPTGNLNTCSKRKPVRPLVKQAWAYREAALSV